MYPHTLVVTKQFNLLIVHPIFTYSFNEQTTMKDRKNILIIIADVDTAVKKYVHSQPVL